MKRGLISGLFSLAAASILLWTTACGSNPSQPNQSLPNPQTEQGHQQSDSTNSLQKGDSTNTDGSIHQMSDSATPNLIAGKESSQRDNKPLTLTDLHHKYRSTFLFNGPQSERKAALTFDDVPDTVFTPQILDILKQYGVSATFFVIGNRAEVHPEIVKRMVTEGHVVGSHSYSHPNLAKTDDSQFHQEILQTEEILLGVTGYKPKLFRPPYGNVTESQIQWLASQNYHVINWNVDSLDWKGLNADQVSSNVLGHVVPGAVILQHGAGGHGEDLTGTVKALPHIIENLQSSGIQLVTIPELFNIPKSL